MEKLRSKLLLTYTAILLLGGASAALGIVQADNCTDAPLVGNVTNLRFDTRGMTPDGPAHYVGGPNIWYRYSASCTGDVTVSLMGSDFDTLLAVYSGGECYPAQSDLIAFNNNFNLLLQSQVTFTAVAGDEFLIEIGGQDSAMEEGKLTITCDGEPGPPASKDDCSKALSIGDVSDLQFDTRTATFDGSGLCMTSANIWYCYTASCTGDVTVSLSGTVFDTMLAVYDGCGCYPTSGDMIDCDDDSGENRASEITFAAVAGNQYLIEIGGYGSEAGEGVLNVSCQEQTTPSKDECVNAEAVGDVKDLLFDTREAEFDGSGLCLTSPNIWYCYTATCTGDVTVSLLDSAFDTMLAVYNGCECYPTQNDMIACNDDHGSSFQSQVTFAAIAGNQYLIEIGGYGSETGQGLLNISCEGKVGTVKPDLGDAPDSTNNSGNKIMGAYPFPPSLPAHFPTVYNDGSGLGPYGPVHLNDLAVAYLGKAITGETEADTGVDEDGINNLRSAVSSPNHDGGDDGVELPLTLPNCGWATFNYQVTVIDPDTDLWVNVWLDFNRDGDWDDIVDCPGGPVSEWAVQNQFLFNLPAGLNEVAVPGFRSVHPEGAHEQIWLRITLSEQPWTGGSNPGQQGNAGSGPLAKYEIGETEDYYFFPEVPASTDCPLCEDVNGDGKIDMDDLADFTAKWLADCL
ncbi:MAG: GEVED domain-containing protein [Planctomycetota bacterium]|nr:GEVED domain-containing protein [Planctomycetota bacterium]